MISPASRKRSEQVPKPTSIISSSLEGVGYFHNEEQDELTRDKHNEKYFFHRYRVGFSVFQYFFFLNLHIIYLSVLGPIIAIPAICAKKFRNLCSNLLITRPSQAFWLQNFIWLSGLANLFAIIDEDNKIGDYMLLHIWITAVVFRSLTIAGKYSTFDRILIKSHLEKKLTIEELRRELLLLKWKTQGPEIIDMEIRCACLRKDIDRRTLKVAFMEDPGSAKKEFSQIVKDASLPLKEVFFSGKADSEASDGSKLIYMDPTLVIHFFARKFNKSSGMKGYHNLYIMVLSYAWAFAGGFIRLARGKKFHGEELLEIIIFYFGALFNGLMISAGAAFYKAAKIDLQRKLYVLRNVGQMISPREDRTISSKKLLPTVNLADIQSVSTWIKLRKIVQNYGRRFFLRHELFMMAATVICTLAIVMAFGLRYLLDNLEEPITEKIEDLTYIILIQYIIVGFLNRRLLRAAALANKEIDSHIHILKKNRDLIQQFIDYEEFYFGNKAKSAIWGGKDKSSFVQKRIVEEIKMLKNGRNVEVKDILEGLLKSYQKGIIELEDEKQYEGIKLFGKPITMKNVGSWGVGFIVLGLLAYELLVRK